MYSVRAVGMGLAALFLWAMAAGALAADSWPAASSRRLGQGQVPVPEVRGLTEALARAELSKAGLQGRVRQEAGHCQDPASAGLVLRQRPEPDQGLPPNSWVDITVCRRQATGRRLEVPNLHGLEEAQARAALAAAGLGLHITKREKCQRPDLLGRVVCQTPPAGEQARAGQRVKVRICRGR